MARIAILGTIAAIAHLQPSYTSSAMSLKSRAHLLDRVQMGKLLGYVHELNNCNDKCRELMIPFEVGGEIVGYVNQQFCGHLCAYDTVFQLTSSVGNKSKLQFTSRVEQSVSSNVMCDDFNRVNEDLRQKGVICGWRDEWLPVTSSFSSTPKLLIERGACSYYGLKAYGVHVNGFVRDAASGRVAGLWVARRAATKSTWPGMLDHIAAGGLPHGIGIIDNVVKECKEEAGIDEELARRAVACGAVSYNGIDSNNHLKRDALFCFDLELPNDFEPLPNDGEVESFQLHPVEWVLDKIIEGGERGYKPNCYLVLIDFFIRHGIIHPESPGYLELIAGLRDSSCS